MPLKEIPQKDKTSSQNNAKKTKKTKTYSNTNPTKNWGLIAFSYYQCVLWINQTIFY